MKTLLSLICVTFSLLAFASGRTAPPDSTTSLADRSSALMMIEQGKQLVNEGRVRDALIIFREAANKDPLTWKASYWVAWCHHHLRNYGYARTYGQEALRKGGEDVDPDVYNILGRSYHQLASLDSAIFYYDRALVELPKNRSRELKIEQRLAECAFAREAIRKDKNQRVPLAGEVNSGFNEYGVFWYDNGKRMYFTSRRGNTTGGRSNPDDQEYFEDIYSAVWNPSTSRWDSVTNDLDRLNTVGFDAITYINPAGTYALLTLNTSATDLKTITNSSEICEAEITKKGKWGPPRIIKNKTINTSFFEGSATMTADGGRMYFVSDRKGEKKQTDIYVVEKIGKSTWGIASALPDTINTPGRETTPYITPDGRYLFFSSDGHNGMGGLDVYVSENLGETWSKPINLGAMVNTVNDDSHFQIYKDLGKAVIAGFNLQGQKSSIDLYQFDLSKLKLPVKL